MKQLMLLLWGALALNILASANDSHALPITTSYVETPDTFRLIMGHGPIVPDGATMMRIEGLGEVLVDEHRVQLGSSWKAGGEHGVLLQLFPNGLPGARRDQMVIHMDVNHVGSPLSIHAHDLIDSAALGPGTTSSRGTFVRAHGREDIFAGVPGVGLDSGQRLTVTPGGIDRLEYFRSVTKENNEITSFAISFNGTHEDTRTSRLSPARLSFESASFVANSSFFHSELLAAAAPEPSTLMLLGSGMPGIILLGKKLAAMRG